MEKQLEIVRKKSDKLSLYRTEHTFLNYTEVTSVEDLKWVLTWAKRNKKRLYLLGNGSNVLFCRRKIKSLICANRMPAYVKKCEGDTYEVGSKTSLSKVLRACYDEQLDSFYYLASVPATVGGAVAMNAGRGPTHHLTIYDYIVKIEYVDESGVHTISPEDALRGYRQTIFTGSSNKIITRVWFDFPASDFTGNPIKDRVQLSKDTQDHGSPNCGSVFRVFSGRILGPFRKLGIGFLGARWSRKTVNWVSNSNPNYLPLYLLIRFTQMMQWCVFKRARLEIITIK